jgi:hypothetical protein
LWGQLISDLRGKEPESVSVQTRNGERAVASKSEMRITDFDVDSAIQDITIAIGAAELVSQRCSPSSIISAQECIDNIRDNEYYSNKVILPILEELATLPKQAKEISYKLIRTEANDGETASKVQDKFYCINPALSSAEKLIWSSVIESAGLAEKADSLILGMRNKICKIYARF